LTNCPRQQQLIPNAHEWISSAAWVWLREFPAGICRCISVVSPFSVHYDTQFATNHQHMPRIWKLWATVATMWPPRWVWQVSNASPSTDSRTSIVICRGTESAFRTSWKRFCQLANIFQLYSSNWNIFRHSCQTIICHSARRFQPQVGIQTVEVPGIPDISPSVNISDEKCDVAKGSEDHFHLGTAEDNPLISLKQTEFPLKPFAKWMGYPSTVHSPNGIKYVWLGLWRKNVVHCPRPELSDTALTRTLALGKSSWRWLGNIRELAAIQLFQ